MEELIAQLLRQRSAQTIQAANAQHQAVLQSLAKPVSVFGDMAERYRQQEKHDRFYAGMRPEDLVTFYRDHPDLVPHQGLTEREAYAQLDASRQGQGTFTFESASPEDRANLDAKRAEEGLSPLPLDPRGNPTERAAVTAGDGSRTAQAMFGATAPDLISSADERNIRKTFEQKHSFRPEPYAGAYNPRGYVSDNPLDLVSDASMQRDDDVQQTGWVPADFNGMSHAAAAALVADQLRTRRIRQMGEMSPDYLQTLPQY